MKKHFGLFFKKYWILLLLIIIKFVLQFIVINPVYELHRDEFLHLDQAFHPAAGFISVPPLISWVSILINILGGGIFWIRFFPALFGVLTLLAIWLIVEELDGGIFAQLLSGTVFVFSVFARVNLLYQPNSFDILAWTIVFYLLVRYIKDSKPNWLYYIAIVSVIGFYNKYNVVFLLMGLFLAILCTDLRKVLARKAFFLALLLGLILFLPNLLWQYNHGFPVVLHMKVLRETQLVHVSSLGFIKDQLLFLAGALPLFVAAFFAFFKHSELKKFKVIGLTFIFVMVIFLLLKAKNYYALGLYPVLFSFGSVYLEKKFPQKFPFISTLYLSINILMFISVVNFMFPVLTPEAITERKEQFESMGLMRWEDGKNHQLPQDFADMIGWKEMAAHASIAYNRLSEEDKKGTLIFCNNYGQAGALNFYNRGRTPEAYSFSTDYLFWIPENLKITNVILIGKYPDNKVVQLFDRIEKIGSVDNQLAREKGTSVYLMSGANEKFSGIFNAEVKRRRIEMDCF